MNWIELRRSYGMTVSFLISAHVNTDDVDEWFISVTIWCELSKTWSYLGHVYLLLIIEKHDGGNIEGNKHECGRWSSLFLTVRSYRSRSLLSCQMKLRYGPLTTSRWWPHSNSITLWQSVMRRNCRNECWCSSPGKLHRKSSNSH